MGEDVDPLTTESDVKPISNRDVLILMAGLNILGSIAGFAIGGAAVGAGMTIGGLLAVVNYIWLDGSLRAMFEQRAGSGTLLLATKYILRYAALGGILLIIYLTAVVPVAPVILGLSSFAIAVVLQGLKNIFKT